MGLRANIPAIPIIARRPLLISFVSNSILSATFLGFSPRGSNPKSPDMILGRLVNKRQVMISSGADARSSWQTWVVIQSYRPWLATKWRLK